MTKYNTLGKRIGAAIIDAIILLPLSFFDSFATINRFYFFMAGMLYLLLWSMYTITLHSFYGQTLGKKIMNIKIYDIDEIKLLPFKKAFLRESIWIGGQFGILLYFTIKLLTNIQLNEDFFNKYNNSAAILTITWTVAELATMFTNTKKRSFQDLIANSVVIQL